MRPSIPARFSCAPSSPVRKRSALLAQYRPWKPNRVMAQTVSQLVEYYEGCIRTHECADLVALTMFIYARKRAAEQAKRKFGSVDEKYMRRAEDLLYGELAAALGIARDEVPRYIAHRVGASPGTIA